MVKNDEDTKRYPNTNYFPNKIASYYNNRVETLSLTPALELEWYHPIQ
jgi:SPX domain protein involved in polyphosphate accumulation